MNLPSYIKTNWKSYGHTILTYVNLNCKMCNENYKETSSGFSFKNLFQKSKETNVIKCSHKTEIQCYWSSFDVW